MLDEADRMLDLGFRDELEAILAQAPEGHRTHLVSATFAREVTALADRVQTKAVRIEGTPLGSANADIDHVIYLVNPKERIDALVKANDVVLFMKGSALFPQCGFSSRAVAILDHLEVPFETVDVLQDQEIRQGIKEYSDWPTIPQLYVKGEFVGGSDIMMEMFESGELQQLLKAEA